MDDSKIKLTTSFDAFEIAISVEVYFVPYILEIVCDHLLGIGLVEHIESIFIVKYLVGDYNLDKFEDWCIRNKVDYEVILVDSL